MSVLSAGHGVGTDRTTLQEEAAADMRLYGRRHGKRLRAGQQQLMTDLLPRLKVELSAAGTLDPAQLFPNKPSAVWLEVGYGGGEHLASQAAAHRDVGFIGCEFFVNGIAKLLRQIDDADLTNVRLYDHDARDLLCSLKTGSLARLFLLFPDPWPKARHHRRRFVQPATLDEAARALAPGGIYRFATDIPDYMRWTLGHVHRHPAFRWLDEGPQDWRERKPDWPPTRYEAKAIREGRPPVYLTFQRI